MRVSRTVFLILGVALAGAASATRPARAIADPVAVALDDHSWPAVVRSRVMRAFISTRRARRGAAMIFFTVTATGEITGEHFDGPAYVGEQAMLSLRKLGHVPPPPDHKSHSISVRFRVR